MTTTITEFILARVAEDEEAANLAVTPGEYDVFIDDERTFYKAISEHRDGWGLYTFNVPPGRVLAECAAKRTVVELHEPGGGAWCTSACESESPTGCDTLRALAAIWSDHADYREEWR